MKKNYLILYPNPFTEFNYFKYEISYLKKETNINKVIIHDLSRIVLKENFYREWKTKLEKKTIKFYSLFSWIKIFLSYQKEKFLIINFVKMTNLESLIINFLVKFSNHTIIEHSPANVFRSIKPSKKNYSFFLSRIKQHKFNLNVYLFGLKNYMYNFILNIIETKKKFILTNDFKKISYKYKEHSKKKIIQVNFNSYDYSNSLLAKKIKNKKKKYILYVDNGAPYFSGDANFKGDSVQYFGNIKNYYTDLNNFFNKLEKYFNTEVIIIPHPKYKSYSKKIKSLNPFFKNRQVNNDHNALPKLTPNCLFFIQKHSTAISFPIFFKKPILLIYSSKQKYARGEQSSLLHLSKILGKKPTDIVNFSKFSIQKSLKININEYEKFKYKYLTPKNKSILNTPNYKILNKLTSEV